MVLKIIATIIIVFAVVLLVLSFDPSVTNFFQKIREGISSFLGQELGIERNVSFSLALDRYEVVSFSGENMSLYINPKLFSGEINNMKLDVKKPFRIIDFDGSGFVGENLTLSGEFGKIELDDITIENGKMSIVSKFNNLTIENLALKEFKTRAFGILIVGNVNTRISSELVEVYYPKGRFEFDGGLKIDGLANRIAIPETKLDIG